MYELTLLLVVLNNCMPDWKHCIPKWNILCPDPSLKFITPIHTQFSRPSNTWDQAVSSVTHPSTLRRRDPTQGKASCISLVPVARSSPSNIESLIANVGNLEKKLKQAYTPVPWNPFPVDFWFSHEPQLAGKKLMTVLANSSAISDYREKVICYQLEFGK